MSLHITGKSGVRGDNDQEEHPTRVDDNGTNNSNEEHSNVMDGDGGKSTDKNQKDHESESIDKGYNTLHTCYW